MEAPVIAVGETGLDLHHGTFTPDDQRVRLSLMVAAPVTRVNWRFRVEAVDHDGLTSAADLRIRQ